MEPLTRASAPNSGEWPMPIWCRMFQKTLDGSARGWFKRLPPGSINEWSEPREAFTIRYSVRKAYFKEPHEITKIVRKANESLTAFKERWTTETGFILGVPEVMKISSFIDSLKCPELAKRYSDKVAKTVEEMMVRLDDFVRSEEAFARTELPSSPVGHSLRVSGETIAVGIKSLLEVTIVKLVLLVQKLLLLVLKVNAAGIKVTTAERIKTAQRKDKDCLWDMYGYVIILQEISQKRDTRTEK
ncbi:reverse transcriptase domain-containing protein [Tanacetum coccineum]